MIISEPQKEYSNHTRSKEDKVTNLEVYIYTYTQSIPNSSVNDESFTVYTV